MSREERIRQWRAAYGQLLPEPAPGGRRPGAGKAALLGEVSDADREYFAQLGEANAAARRATESPAGSLAVAFERMGMIERNMGVDVVATVRAGQWPDRESHMSLLAAVKDKIAVAGSGFGMDGSRE